MTQVLIVDCETTGIGKQDEPISIGLISFRADAKGRPIEDPVMYEGFRYPSVPIHPRAQEVHGMARDSLQGQVFDDAVVISMIEQAEVLIAHNAQFDSKMLARLYPAVLKKNWRCSWKQWPWAGDTPNKKLDSACSLFNVDRPQTHGALKDAQALLDCLLQRSGKTERSSTYLKKILERTDVYIGADYSKDLKPERARIDWSGSLRPTHEEAEETARRILNESSSSSDHNAGFKPTHIILGLVIIFVLAKCVSG